MSEKKKEMIDLDHLQEQTRTVIHHQLSRIRKTKNGYAAEYCAEIKVSPEEHEKLWKELLQKIRKEKSVSETEEPCLLVPVCKGVYCYSVDEYTVSNNGSEINLVSSEKHFLYIDENHDAKEIQLSELPAYIQ